MKRVEVHLPQDGFYAYTSRRYAVFVLAYIALVVLWSVLIPFNRAPDEHSHAFWPEVVAATKRLPAVDVDPKQEIAGRYTPATYKASNIWYFGLPFLHGLGAIVTGELIRNILPAELIHLSLRAINWAFAGLYVTFLYLSFRTLQCSRRLSLLATLPLALIPQVTFIFAYFNHDAFGLAVAAFVVYAAALCSALAYKRSYGHLFGFSLGLLALAKPYHWPIAFFVATWIASAWPYGVRAGTGALFQDVAPVALFVAVPMFAANYLAYGDLTGLMMSHRFLQQHPDFSAQAQGVCFFFCGEKRVNWRWTIDFLTNSFRSFFGLFDYMLLPVPEWIYTWVFAPIAVLTMASIAFGASALFASACRRSGYARQFFSRMSTLCLAWISLLIGLVALSMWFSARVGYQPQGRYLFVALPALVPILALSLRRGSQVDRDKGTENQKTWLPFALGNTLVVVSVGLALSQIVSICFVLPIAYAEHIGQLLNKRTPVGFGSDGHEMQSQVKNLDTIAILRAGRDARIIGYIEHILKNADGSGVVLGWAADTGRSQPADLVVATLDERIIGYARPSEMRDDVAKALGSRSFAGSGYQIKFSAALPDAFDRCRVKVFAIGKSGRANLLPDVVACQSAL